MTHTRPPHPSQPRGPSLRVWIQTHSGPSVDHAEHLDLVRPDSEAINPRYLFHRMLGQAHEQLAHPRRASLRRAPSDEVPLARHMARPAEVRRLVHANVGLHRHRVIRAGLITDALCGEVVPPKMR